MNHEHIAAILAKDREYQRAVKELRKNQHRGPDPIRRNVESWLRKQALGRWQLTSNGKRFTNTVL